MAAAATAEVEAALLIAIRLSIVDLGRTART
jgi:hypothetical protein